MDCVDYANRADCGDYANRTDCMEITQLPLEPILNNLYRFYYIKTNNNKQQLKTYFLKYLFTTIKYTEII